MLLDTQAAFVRSTVLGFRADSTGALSSNWALNTGDTTPGDIHIFADGGINVCRQPDTAVVSPEIAYTPRQFTDSRYFRFRATLRVHGETHSSIGASNKQTEPLELKMLVSLIYGDVFGSGTSGVRLSFGGIATVLNFTVTLNQWYRVVFERVGDRALVYTSSTGATTPDGVPADNDLTVFIDSTVSGASVEPMWGEFATSGVGGVPIDATHYPGVSDFILEEFKPLPKIRTVSHGFSVPQPTSYTRYKNIRAAVGVYNNLVVGP